MTTISERGEGAGWRGKERKKKKKKKLSINYPLIEKKYSYLNQRGRNLFINPFRCSQKEGVDCLDNASDVAASDKLDCL